MFFLIFFIVNSFIKHKKAVLGYIEVKHRVRYCACPILLRK